MTGLFRWLNGLMLALFLLAVVVQWNDPDPIAWMSIYGAAGGVCLLVALRRPFPAAAPIVVGLVALVWSVATVVAGPGVSVYSHMFDAWEMQSAPIEFAREATGLLIVAAWMAVIVMRRRRGNGGA